MSCAKRRWLIVLPIENARNQKTEDRNLKSREIESMSENK
jgi:hypothetical protein